MTDTSKTPRADREKYWNALPKLSTSESIVPHRVAAALEAESNMLLEALELASRVIGNPANAGMDTIGAAIAAARKAREL